MEEKEIVVALDIGTTKICVMAGAKDANGKIEILGLGQSESSGVLRGIVSNIEKTVQAISEAVELVEKQCEMEVNVVNVGIAGQHIKSVQHRGVHTRQSAHNEISKEDVDKLIKDMHRLLLPPGDKIIHAIPQEYIVDNDPGIVDPVGMSGVRLEANFHIITGQITAIRNIQKCVEKANLDMQGLTLEPIASSRAVLSKEEMEAGVALVDIGGGTTDLAIFHEGIIRHTAVIPFGGNVVTKDIKEGCSVMQGQAEKLKLKFGSALASEVKDNLLIAIPGLKGRPDKEISELTLARIIQARMEEIIEQVFWEIRGSNYAGKLTAGIVLTGGGSLLRELSSLCESITGMPTRVGAPIEHLAHGYDRVLTSPKYATAIGLIIKGFEDLEQGDVSMNEFDYVNQFKGADAEKPKAKQQAETEKGGFFQKVFTRTKDWFTANPDNKF